MSQGRSQAGIVGRQLAHILNLMDALKAYAEGKRRVMRVMSVTPK